jgi:hypothetical protein
MLVDEMLAAVRQLSDEDNTSDIADSDILGSLNRGQQRLVRMAAKRYEPMFMRESTITSFSGREATLPDNSYALTINTVDISESGTYFRVYPAPIRSMTELETGTTSRPQYFAVRGNKLLLYPTPAAGTTLRLRYQIRPPKLVGNQGRITSYDSVNNYLYLDAIGTELTTSIAELKAFINIVDSSTGLLKSTLQISAIDTAQKRLTIKTSGLNRTTVFGNTVDVALPADIEYDDYVCIADGTCVPTLVSDYSDYLIQYAVVETLNRLGIPAQEANVRLKELEDDVSTMWAGRPVSIQVAQFNRHWNRK